ncbi:interleukin-6 [Tupaia chinensis]|uniref:Interleukin-6 n=2 Tax=Tupaia belangeri TaxID=37347 RepID=A0A1B2LSN3_TUPBE|nr:interleukin-6 [Tupaia chinensis]AOA49837.1 interleukin-6 [Tupaia belangeri]AOA49838.1 interleukin-6 [Tupaia belangeri]
MTSLSTSTFSPVAFSLGLLLVMATALPTPVLLGEDSQDGAILNIPEPTSTDKTEDLAKYILEEINVLKQEACDSIYKCRVALAKNNLNLPKMAEKDGCFHNGFNKDTCLMRIITGLLEFQVYIEFLKNNVNEKSSARAVQIGTKALMLMLKQKETYPSIVPTPDPTSNASLMVKMQSQEEWLKKVTVRLILRSLEDFLQYTVRASRLM